MCIPGKCMSSGRALLGSAWGCLRRNLVDPASSDMLVSRIKPCMCKHKCVYSEAAGAHYISYCFFDGLLPRIPLVILELILAHIGRCPCIY